MPKPHSIHLLNGDMLLQAFPAEAIPGQRLVFRECLIEGPLAAETGPLFWQRRAAFLNSAYGVSAERYQETTLQELGRLPARSSTRDINLWFENDLFCQVNLWFLVAYLHQQQLSERLYRVYPLIQKPNSPWTVFADHTAHELEQCFLHRQPFTEADIALARALWSAYARGDDTELLALSSQPSSALRMLPEIVEAQLDRKHNSPQTGRPEIALMALRAEGFSEDDALFREFSKREPIWGFGDWQVKRLLKGLPG
jgi:hypothetical protein